MVCESMAALKPFVTLALEAQAVFFVPGRNLPLDKDELFVPLREPNSSYEEKMITKNVLIGE